MLKETMKDEVRRSQLDESLAHQKAAPTDYDWVKCSTASSPNQ
jgi:hypothetical protein